MGGKNSVAIVAELGSVWKTCFLAAEDVGGIGRRPALASDPNEEVVCEAVCANAASMP